MKSILFLLFAAVVAATTGCASALINEDALAERAAFALGMKASDLTISSRSDEGASTRYQVRSHSGQEFNCSIGVTVSVLGRQVTDAICSKRGAAQRNPLLR